MINSNLPNTALCGDLILTTVPLPLQYQYFVQLVDVRVRVQIKIAGFDVSSVFVFRFSLRVSVVLLD